MRSEEVVKLNVALRYCDQLKNNLQASILYVQMLNRKYNTTDYNESFSSSIIGSSRKNNSSMQQTNEQPQTLKKEIRSVKDIKHNFNNIIVSGIKLRREVETTTTQLKLLRNEHQVESPYVIKRRLLSANDSAVSTPVGCRHGRCFQNESDIVGSSRDKSAVMSAKKTNRSCSGYMQQTPQRKRTRQTVNQLVMDRAAGTPDVNVKKFRFQSTPIHTNKPSSTATTNGSCSRSIVAMNNSNGLTSSLIADDKLSSTMHSPIRPCFRNTTTATNASKRELCDTPKRICWTPIVNVKKISVYWTRDL